MKRSLSSATQWLTSTATRLFSSSSESVKSAPATSSNNSKNEGGATEKQAQAQHKKQARKNMTFSREIRSLKRVIQSRTRSLSVQETEDSNPGEEVRYLLTLKALPKHLQLIAQLLHPHPQDKYEEHRLACKLYAEDEDKSAKREIFIPTFRHLPPGSHKGLARDSQRPSEREAISDLDCLQRHRPLELAERRERRREEELLRYEEYIRKLSREYPELLNRKSSFSTSTSKSSIS